MNAKFVILQSLQRCGEYMLPEPALISEVTLNLGRVPISDITLALRELESSRLIVSAKPQLSDITKYRITAEGKAALAEVS